MVFNAASLCLTTSCLKQARVDARQARTAGDSGLYTPVHEHFRGGSQRRIAPHEFVSVWAVDLRPRPDLLPAIAQPIANCLALCRRHLPEALAKLLATIRRQLPIALEVVTYARFLTRRQILELAIAIANGGALVVAQRTPFLESVARC